jgi:heme-degrading monooxygenase HmoA
MFARTVEIKAKTGKAGELIRIVNDQVLTLLKNQPGFVDEITLLSKQEPDRVLGMSFWKTREDAEKYNRETFPKVTELMRNMMEGTPLVHTFDVANSTAHNIVAGKAA